MGHVDYVVILVEGGASARVAWGTQQGGWGLFGASETKFQQSGSREALAPGQG